jgi:hypothetical protein
MAKGFGRGSIFRPKDGQRVQGDLTQVGTEMFEERRRQLCEWSGRTTVSDADVVESFMRGLPATRRACALVAKG